MAASLAVLPETVQLAIDYVRRHTFKDAMDDNPAIEQPSALRTWWRA
jgi:hypothetical protein